MKKFKLTSSANGKVFRSGLYSTAILKKTGLRLKD